MRYENARALAKRRVQAHLRRSEAAFGRGRLAGLSQHPLTPISSAPSRIGGDTVT
jgi:hypothetical protein